jgi:hypothetical protein
MSELTFGQDSMTGIAWVEGAEKFYVVGKEVPQKVYVEYVYLKNALVDCLQALELIVHGVPTLPESRRWTFTITLDSPLLADIRRAVKEYK